MISGACCSPWVKTKSFPLPDIDETYDTTGGEAREVIEEMNIKVDEEDESL